MNVTDWNGISCIWKSNAFGPIYRYTSKYTHFWYDSDNITVCTTFHRRNPRWSERLLYDNEKSIKTPNWERNCYWKDLYTKIYICQTFMKASVVYTSLQVLGNSYAWAEHCRLSSKREKKSFFWICQYINRASRIRLMSGFNNKAILGDYFQKKLENTLAIFRKKLFFLILPALGVFSSNYYCWWILRSSVFIGRWKTLAISIV